MDTHMIVEMTGYIGSLLVLVSFLMSSVVKLRVINSIGGFIFAIYALMIQSYPTAFMNVCLVAINLYYLGRLKKKDQHFDLIDGKSDDAFLNYILNYYKEDIGTYFPEWDTDQDKSEVAYIVCCDAVPAGLLLGKMKSGETMEIMLDYSVPAYRDCSVGKYLYSRLSARGIKQFVFAGKANNHESYLNKMGFTKENNVYIKETK